MSINLEVFDESIFNIINPNDKLQVIATGFTFVEGPIWNDKENSLIFSDIPESITYKLDKNNCVSVVVRNNNKSNGNCYDINGRIISCEHGKSRLCIMNSDGENRRVLVSQYKGLELNSPNDVVVKSDGLIYFTDPNFGRKEFKVGVLREQQLSFQGVFKFDPNTNELKVLVDHFQNPNGLCFSKDEKHLFINDNPTSSIFIFDVNGQGDLENERLWAVTKGAGVGLPDGMKIDVNENIYCCAQGGVHIFNKHAKCLGIIHMPEQTGNLTFGDNDLSSIYFTSSTTIYKVKTKTQGVRNYTQKE